MSAEHKGPSLWGVAVVHVVLFVAAVVVPTVLNGGEHFPMPTDEPTRFFLEHPGSVALGAFLMFGSSLPLAIFAATASSRLAFFGLRVAGSTIALVGGIFAAIMVALSGLLQAALPHLANLEVAHALHRLAFLTGGVGAVVPLGLLFAGLAITTGLTKLVPFWVALAGVIVAAVAELSSLVLVLPGLVFLLPLARFGGLLWLVVFALNLPKSKRSVVDV